MASLKDRIKSMLKRKSRSKQANANANAPTAASPSTTRNLDANPSYYQAPQTKAPAAGDESAPAPAPQQQEQHPIVTQSRVVASNDQSTKQAATTTGTLQVALVNQSSSSQAYAYITGQAIDNNNALFLLTSDAKTPYYPPSPSSTGSAINANINIPMGAPGNTVTATIPRIAGGRIWFSIGSPLTFKVNPGPGLVEPSVFNPSDPNYNVNFGFCEFTFNSAQVFINISYVDFVSNVPVALTLQDTTGATQHVSGMRSNGLATVAAGLRAQTAKDGRRWSSLIQQVNGQDLRALSPNSGITLNPDWFATYWTDYVNQVYTKYQTTPLTINTQASFGDVAGQVNTSSGALDYNAGGQFQKPTSADIFGNSTGPFATGGNAETNAIIPRLAAAFNRSTLLLSNVTPNGTNASQYYTNATTNHYARIVHAANVDGLGYAFPYDDVAPNGGKGQEGAIFSFSPTLLTVTMGGNNAYAA